jgi:hypothetical protein
MGIEDIAKIAALAGVISGIVSKLIELWWRWGDKRDKIQVVAGPTSLKFGHFKSLYVVSKSDHLVEVVEYGFVLNNTDLFSIPNYLVNFEPYDVEDFAPTQGTRKLERRGQRYEISLEPPAREFPVIAVYARTATQRHVQIAFPRRSLTPLTLRLWTRLKIRIAPRYTTEPY